MFICLTGPDSGQVLINLNLVSVVIGGHGTNAVYFDNCDDHVMVTESIEEIHERIQSAEKMNGRKNGQTKRKDSDLEVACV